jgi:hypothetical protein
MHFWSASFALILSLALLSCGGVDLTNRNLDQSESKNSDQDSILDDGNVPVILSNNISFTQSDSTMSFGALDLLFIVDTSGSILAEKESIKTGITGFLNALPDGTDTKIGVMPAHGVETSTSGVLFQSVEGEDIVLDGASTSLVQDFANKFDFLPTEGVSDGGEAGFLALINSLNDRNLEDNLNAGFFRSDSVLAVIFVADENDLCTLGSESDPQNLEIPFYEEYCLTPLISPEYVLGQLESLWPAKPILASGVIYTGFSPFEMTLENEIGHGYFEMVEQTQGFFIDLAETDLITQRMADLGTYTAETLNNLRQSIQLLHSNIIEASISVRINGQDVGFEYNASTRIVFLPDPGNAGDQVSVSYDYISE